MSQSTTSAIKTVKPWGEAVLLANPEGLLVRHLTVAPGQALSLQSHEHHAEHWLVLDGTAEIEIDGARSVLGPGELATAAAGTKHRIVNNASVPLLILEIQHGERISEADVRRYSDRYGRPVGSRSTPGRRALTPPVAVCEIGCNHKGDFAIALEMIKIAAQFCKVDVVKFQKRNNRELLAPAEYSAPHPNPVNAYGDTYGAHREFLEFTADQHRVLKNACEEWGVVYSTSVWDISSAREVVALDPQLIKIPSAANTNFPVLDYLCENYRGEIHVSLGMTLRAEEEQIIRLFDRRGRLRDLVLYHCTSGYPVPEDDLYLLEIPRLITAYGGAIKGIGFSGHHTGIAPDIAALTLGATHFERHFTLDRTWKGTDHAASLEPDGMRRLARDLRDVSRALRQKSGEIAPIEEAQRKKLKRFVAP